MLNQRRSVAGLMSARYSLSGLLVLLVLLVLLTGCAGSLPPATHSGAETAVLTDDSFLSSQSRQRLADANGQSGYYLLDSGQDAFLYRAAMIEAAEHRIDAQYYIWNCLLYTSPSPRDS